MRNLFIYLTQDEIDLIKRKGNLTKQESALLELRINEKTLCESAEVLGVSDRTVQRIHARLKDKMCKLL